MHPLSSHGKDACSFPRDGMRAWCAPPSRSRLRAFELNFPNGRRFNLRKPKLAAWLIGVAIVFVSPFARGQTVAPIAGALITGSVDETRLVPLPGNTRPEATPENDRGPVADGFPLPHLLLQLRRPPEQESTLEQLLDDLQDPKSPNFHKWLKPEQFGQSFGIAQQDLDAITQWLQSHGFTVNSIYPSRMLIDFSGTAGQIREEFHTEIHNLDVNGIAHIANMSDPQIPEALAPAILGIVSLHDFKPRGMHEMRKPVLNYTISSATQAVVPADLATIYNLNPLFAKGYSGQGQTIVVIEDTDVHSTSDWTTFRSTFGLSTYAGTFSTTHPAPQSGANNCTDPGVIANTDAEAIIDAEWASAAAPSAAIQLASCADTFTTFGGLIALQNLINADSPPALVSISYGECEAENGSSANAAYNAAYQQAVSEGTSVFVSAGDSGAADCDDKESKATHGIGVNALASTPYNVAMGGTDFSDTYSGTNSSYWSSTNTATYGSALSYIPEIPWNDSCASLLLANHYTGSGTTYGKNGFCNSTQGESFLTTTAGSGGPSACATGSPTSTGIVSGTCQGWPKPSWQSALSNYGNPNDGVRDLPDLSLFASQNEVWGHYYVICWSDTANGGAPCTGAPSGWSGFGGTSFTAPIMAGIQALVNQKTGQSQGNPNPTYYQLAASEYNLSSSACNSSNGNGVASTCVFYDVTSGDMDVNCKSGNGSHDCYSDSATNGVLSTANTSYEPAYGTTTGWDFATGIGSVNAVNLVNNWPTPPSITSAASTTFSVGTQGMFTVTATGTPTPTLTESGALPSGVTFNTTTGVLGGTPSGGSGGIYNITFTASDGVGANATQNFALTVNQTPAITSANSTSFMVGSPGTFTVTATGFPVATLAESGTLPSGVTFNAATGVLSGTPATGTAGVYNISFTASNGVGTNALQGFTLTITSNTVSGGATATFLLLDSTTQGNWLQTYGADGYSVATQTPALPTYDPSFAVQGQQNWTWASSTNDPRALQLPGTMGRIATTWFNSPTFNFDVNITDGNRHQFALYAVDWDTSVRAETIQVQDANTGAVLDTRNISQFSNGIYVVWNVSGHVTITVTCTGAANAVISGAFFGGSGLGSENVTITPPSVSLNAGQQQQFSALVSGTSNQAVTWSVSSVNPPTAPTGSISATGLYTAPNPITPAQVTINATSADGTASGAAVVNLTAGAVANFTASDTSTEGSWHGVYGADGYSVANDSQSIPSYASFAVQNQMNYTWGSNTTDPRALQTGTGSGRIAATWFSSSTFNFDVNITDGNLHRFALYAVDWDSSLRAETIQILDANTGAVLDTRNISQFGNGIYLVWNISGHATITVTCTGGANAVISGAFFGGSGIVSITPPNLSLNARQQQQFNATVSGTSNQSVIWSISSVAPLSAPGGTISAAGLYTAPDPITPAQVTIKATSTDADGTSGTAAVNLTTGAIANFVSSDTSTEGNWYGVYGADGYSVANDSQSIPGYASFAVQNQMNYTWASSTSDPRALQTGSGTGRIAATWFNSSTFNFDVNITDGNRHQFALYAVDWDTSVRAETIQVQDANTGAVLDTRNISQFSNGIYLVWNISGHVTVTVTCTGGANAVISGAFFGGGATGGGSGSTPPPSITNLSPTSGPVSTSVTITGTNFGSTQGSSTVTFNGTTASPTNWSPTAIVVSVPVGATTGNVTVTVSGLASNGINFTVTAPASSISRTGSCSAATPSCTLSAAATGNLNLFFAYSSGSSTPPSLPSGYTSIATGNANNGGTTGSYLLYCKVASSPFDTSSGTAQNASAVAGVSYSGTTVDTLAVPGTDCPVTGVSVLVQNSAASSTTVTYGGLTVENPNNWIVAFLGDSAGSTCTSPNLTGISNAGEVTVSDSNGTVASFSQGACSVTSSTWISVVLQVRGADPIPASSPGLYRSWGYSGTSGNNGEYGNPWYFALETSGPRQLAAGHLLLLYLKYPSPGVSVSSVTDNGAGGGNSYLVETSCSDSKHTYAVYYTLASEPATQIQVNFSAAIDDFQAVYRIYDQVSSSSPFDGPGECTTGITPTNDQGSNVQAGVYTTSINNDLIDAQFWDSVGTTGASAQTYQEFGSGFTGLYADPVYGGLGEFATQSAAGAINPGAGYASSSLDTYAAIVVAVEQGSSGPLPGSGIGIVRSEMFYDNGLPSPQLVPLPTSGNLTVVDNEAGNAGESLIGVADNEANGYAGIAGAPAYLPNIYWASDTAPSNSTVLQLTTSGANVDLIGIFDVSGAAASPLDTGATAANSSSLTAPGSGATYNSGYITSTPQTVVDAPSIVPSKAGDFCHAAIVNGIGPLTGSVNFTWDYVFGTGTGDSNSFDNGDGMSHVLNATTGVQQFEYTSQSPVGSSWSGLAVCFMATQ